MSFARQMQRASQRQELVLSRHVMNQLQAENTQLLMEIKALQRAIGALVLVSGGEVRVPRDMDAYLKGKNLQTDLDEEANEYVFKVVDTPEDVEEDSATKD